MRKSKLLHVLCLLVLVFALLIPVYAAPQVKLTVWGRDITDDGADHAYIKALVNNFKAKNPDIDLEYIALGDPGLMDKTKVAMSNNKDLPDIFQSWGGSVMGGYADAGRMLDLTKELKSIPGSAAAQQAMTWKGKIYGVAPSFAIAGVFYNEGIFKKNNLTVPTTIDQLEKVADTLKSKGIQPFACGAKDKWPVLALFMYLTDRSGGVQVFNDASARKISFNSAEFIKAAQKYQEWAKKGYFGDKPLGEAYNDSQQLMATGKAAMHISGSWLCAQYANKEFTDQTIGFFAFPEMKGGKGKITDVMGMPDIAFAVSKAAANKKDAVVSFLKYAMSVEACQAEPGRIVSVPGVKAHNPLTEAAAGVFGKSKAVQFWWDQNLPPMVTTPLLDAMQNIFLPDGDVKKAFTTYESLVEENMGPVKK
jgi:ABC-type glycerol-3-phosphate transport system substrate-binding protein